MASDTRDHVGNAVLSFTQQVGVLDEFITDNHQHISGSGTKWDRICREKYIHHMIADTYCHWQNSTEGSWRDILRLYEKKCVQKGVPQLLSPYLIIGAATPTMKL